MRELTTLELAKYLQKMDNDHKLTIRLHEIPTYVLICMDVEDKEDNDG